MKDNKRVVIENVRPEVDGGKFPAKAVVGSDLAVTADVFADGHDSVNARLLYRHQAQRKWRVVAMKKAVRDRWEGSFSIEKPGCYLFRVEGWIDHFTTWQKDLKKRVDADQDVKVDLVIGAELIEKVLPDASREDANKLKDIIRQLKNPRDIEAAVMQALGTGLREIVQLYDPRDNLAESDRELSVIVEPALAGFSAWYELFPRSYCSGSGKPGTFKSCRKRLKDIAEMGFDVVYLPPIHPIGKTNRKGKNNSTRAKPDDPGSPWAIGSKEGGHKAIHPDLGTMKDFSDFVAEARKLGLEIALDLAYQCSQDHPYIKKHPEWFKWRPDGTIQFAENPPKKYQDVVPFDFETDDWKNLWDELKSIVDFWIEAGVKIFRVDNPHTKPFGFWEWLIAETRNQYPEVIFLSEAFTRPSVKYRLAKIGFNQSYTYFTWRNTKHEIIQYVNELSGTDLRHFFRPNFWPNTPDILPEFLQFGGRPAFLIRLVLAATLSSNYGIYGPAFELCVNEAVPGTEEYKNSEKYEIKDWEPGKAGNFREFITNLNQIRRENPALQDTDNVSFHEVSNDQLLFYIKKTPDLSNVLFIMVNLDPFHTQSGFVRVPLDELGLMHDKTYMAYDLISDDKFIWQGEENYIELNPHITPIHIFQIHSRMRRESDFDYYL